MYEIIFLEKALLKIDYFIETYLNSFLHLFEDSGINNVELIEYSYIKISNELKIKVLIGIKSALKEKVVGKRIGENNELSIIIIVGNYRLFIDFTENNIEKIRYVENIEFYRK